MRCSIFFRPDPHEPTYQADWSVAQGRVDIYAYLDPHESLALCPGTLLETLDSDVEALRYVDELELYHVLAVRFRALASPHRIQISLTRLGDGVSFTELYERHQANVAARRARAEERALAKRRADGNPVASWHSFVWPDSAHTDKLPDPDYSQNPGTHKINIHETKPGVAQE
jgi:hypothetical protein